MFTMHVHKQQRAQLGKTIVAPKLNSATNFFSKWRIYSQNLCTFGRRLSNNKKQFFSLQIFQQD